MSWRRFLYSVVAYLALPIIFLRLLWRSRQQPAYRQRLSERLALSHRVKQAAIKTQHQSTLKQQPIILMHTVSVGEAMAARPLVQGLLADYPDAILWLTATTSTGSDTLKRLWAKEWGTRVQHAYLPYDLPDAVARFLRQIQPNLVLVLETELWPNLYAACAKRQIPLCLVNARLSERSVKGYQKLAGLVRETLRYIQLIAAREPTDAQHFIALGARPERVMVAGNIKFDLPLANDWQAQAVVWQQHWQGRPVWVAASTHAGEEELVLAAHRQLLERQPTALLILVPRHPERFATVAELVQQLGLSLKRRSQEMPKATTQVWLADSMGELTLWYASADIAFIGGSLVDIGGHNPLEALLFAKPVITGAATYNFADVYADLFAQGGATLVESADDLAHYLLHYFADSAAAQTMGQVGQAFLQQHQGVVKRLMQQLKTML